MEKGLVERRKNPIHHQLTNLQNRIMSFRGRGRGRGFGSSPAGGGGRGSYGGYGGYGGQSSYGPPDTVLEMGQFMHASEGDLLCESINPKIPYFNAQIFLQNKSAIGKVDEILGPMNGVLFTVKPQEGIQATSFKAGDKFYIAPDKLLPLERFLPKAPVPKQKRRAGAGRGMGTPRGGRGGFRGRGSTPRGSRGSFSRGGPRGGFGARGRGRGR